VTRVLLHGLEAFQQVLEQLDSRTRASVHDEAARLADRGVTAALRGSANYPKLLNMLENAPLHYLPLGYLVTSEPGIGVCGSLNVSDEGLRAAQFCGQMAATMGLISVSGYASGVDMAVHVSTLEHDDSTIIVYRKEYRTLKSRAVKLMRSGRLAER
jgi:predicted Rossmann fold nucleotide-binding protein DprA/Smf involved in DNA uptake